MSNTSLNTDLYELTMIAGSLPDKVATRQAVFEVYARSLPTGRRYGIVGGVGRVADAVRNFHFDDEAMRYLATIPALTKESLRWLENYTFTGDIRAYPEGDLYFPNSPILTVKGTFAEAVVLETAILSILNRDSAIASAATRMVEAARGRNLIEMGTRRTDMDAAPHAARMAVAMGFAGTSNLKAGHIYGLPVAGTSAHAFTLAHDNEVEAFRAQMDVLGTGTTLLVDTYDIEQGIKNAIQVSRQMGVPGPGAIRIDSGDLQVEVPRARDLLDRLGAIQTKIVVSSDLDEFSIDALAEVPVDTFGVGTRLVMGSQAPTSGFVYKLVAIEDSPGHLRPVAKRSIGKASIGGEKWAWRNFNDDGLLLAESLSLTSDPHFEGDWREMSIPIVLQGDVVLRDDWRAVREYHQAVMNCLPESAKSVMAGDPYIKPVVVEGHQPVTQSLTGGIV